MGRGCSDGGFKVVCCLIWLGLVVPAGPGEFALAQDAPSDEQSADAEPAAPAETTENADNAIEENFSQYLHFALIGQFDIADKYGDSLLAHPDLNPLSEDGAAKLLELTDTYEDSIDVLLLIINNTSISDNARKVLDLIRQAHRGQRMDPTRINESIRLLAGTPTQRATGMERLLDSGEYAVPWMIEVLADPRRKDLHPFVVRALPQLGKKALNPLVQALSIDNAVLQRCIAEALGKIGYPQGLAYLKRIAEDPDANPAVRQACAAAIHQITVADPAVTEQPAAALFHDLGEQYYAEKDSLRPDPREERANVWFATEGTVKPIEVPRDVFPLVMCMRCCEASLNLRKDQPDVVALWLTANFRREARLGLNVQMEDVVETADLTRPMDFLRSVYFARCAGPAHCQLVLQRAIRDRDRNVALGAIAALNTTAGPAAMVDPAGKTGMSLASALSFPDLLVRIKAALALARAQPPEPFRGADEVVPILASALSLTGQKFFLLVEPDPTARENIAEGLSRAEAEVLAADRLSAALTRAHKERTHLDGIFLASDMRPPAVEAIRTLAGDPRFALTPVVIYIKESDTLVADQIAEADHRVGRVLVVTGNGAPGPDFAELLLKKKDQIAGQYGYEELDATLSVALALDAAAVLRSMVTSGTSVFDAKLAQPALIEALGHPSEELRIAAAAVLARLDTEGAQRAIAAVALADTHSESLRQAAFSALAESARQFGSHLDEAQTGKLIEQAFGEPNLKLRTAASQVLGALNLPGDRAADIITSREAP